MSRYFLEVLHFAINFKVSNLWGASCRSQPNILFPCPLNSSEESVFPSISGGPRFLGDVVFAVFGIRTGKGPQERFKSISLFSTKKSHYFFHVIPSEKKVSNWARCRLHVFVHMGCAGILTGSRWEGSAWRHHDEFPLWANAQGNQEPATAMPYLDPTVRPSLFSLGWMPSGDCSINLLIHRIYSIL